MGNYKFNAEVFKSFQMQSDTCRGLAPIARPAISKENEWMRLSAICFGALTVLNLTGRALADAKSDILPRAYLPPQNLSIQESIDHILTGYEAMGTYGELHRTLKVFRPSSDHADLVEMFRGLEREPLPPIRSNGLAVFVEIRGRGKLEVEVVNAQKSRFRIQGIAWAFDINKPFAQSIAEIRGLIYKSAHESRIKVSLFPTAQAQDNSGIPKLAKGFFEIVAGYFTHSISCGGDSACLARVESQKTRGKPHAPIPVNDEDLSQSRSIAYFSKERVIYCVNSGKQLPAAGIGSPKNCRGLCPDHSSCKNAIGDYEYYCNLLKQRQSKKYLEILKGEKRSNVDWNDVDCKKDFHYFVIKQDINQQSAPPSPSGKGIPEKR